MRVGIRCQGTAKQARKETEKQDQNSLSRSAKVSLILTLLLYMLGFTSQRNRARGWTCTSSRGDVRKSRGHLFKECTLWKRFGRYEEKLDKHWWEIELVK